MVKCQVIRQGITAKNGHVFGIVSGPGFPFCLGYKDHGDSVIPGIPCRVTMYLTAPRTTK